MKKRNFKAPSGATIAFTELGFGAAPLGNLYRAVSEADARALSLDEFAGSSRRDRA